MLMRNTIRYYYLFDDIYVSKINYTNYIKYKNKIYVFVEILNQDMVLEAYQLTKDYPEYEKIIVNKDKSIFTPYNNKIYVLIEKKQSNAFPPLREVSSTTKLLLDRTNWSLLWSKKVDYYEYQFKHIKGLYKSIDESFEYYIGMTESSISYINYNIGKTNLKKCLCRNRMVEKEYYNPLNIVIDHRSRDIGESLKTMFWNNNYNTRKIKNTLSQIDLTLENCMLIYARLLYPSYYFDAYEMTITNRTDETNIKKIISRIEEYEKFVSEVFSILQGFNRNLVKIEWL